MLEASLCENKRFVKMMRAIGCANMFRCFNVAILSNNGLALCFRGLIEEDVRSNDIASYDWSLWRPCVCNRCTRCNKQNLTRNGTPSKYVQTRMTEKLSAYSCAVQDHQVVEIRRG